MGDNNAEEGNNNAWEAAANAFEVAQLQQAHPELGVNANAAVAAALQAQFNAAGVGLAGAAGNNDDEEDENNDDWPNNNALAPLNAGAPAVPAPPAAPLQPKRRLGPPLTAEEKVALATPRPTEPQSFSADITERVEEALYAIFYPGFNTVYANEKTKSECIEILRTLLKSKKAILSGGFLLKTILNISDADWNIPDLLTSANLDYREKTKLDDTSNQGLDLDFYVPCKHLEHFYVKLIPLFQASTVDTYNASFYCQSFLRKNGIRSVYKFKREAPNLVGNVNQMDIMAVRNKRSPIDVVKNFDLSVCQVWYDGKSVKATDPEHILKKVAYLQGDYVKTYLQGNRFLDWRLSKYTKRGFKIVLDPKAIVTLSPTEIIKKAHNFSLCKYSDEERTNLSTPEFMRKWLFRGMLHYFKYGNYVVSNTLNDPSKKRHPILYKAENRKELKKKIDRLDGYDTDDYIDNPQLLRDLVQKPLKEYAEDFLELFDEENNTNPFYNLILEKYEYFDEDDIDTLVKQLHGYKLIKAVETNLDTLLAPPIPQDGGKRHRRTKKRRSALQKV